MSDLQRQLQKVAIDAPIAAHVKTARQGGRASFLYDGAEALEISIKTVHEIGLNGNLHHSSTFRLP